MCKCIKWVTLGCVTLKEYNQKKYDVANEADTILKKEYMGLRRHNSSLLLCLLVNIPSCMSSLHSSLPSSGDCESGNEPQATIFSSMDCAPLSIWSPDAQWSTGFHSKPSDMDSNFISNLGESILRRQSEACLLYTSTHNCITIVPPDY